MNTQQTRKSEVYSVSHRRRSNNERTRSNNNRPCSSTVCMVSVSLVVLLSVGAGIGLGIFLYPEIMPLGIEVTPGQTIDIQTDINSTEVIVETEETEENEETAPIHVHLNSLDCGKLDSGARSELFLQYRNENQASNATEKQRNTRIVGGEKSSSHKLPWQASLWIEDQHTCGGSIIASNWILTAAHCTAVYPSPKNWTVYVGATYLTEMEEAANFSQIAFLTDVFSHPDFDEYTYDNDVALLRLDRHLVMSQRVSTICLMESNVTVSDEADCLISGWGLLEEGGVIPNVLREASVGIIDRNLCNGDDWLMGLVSDVMLCAGTEDGSIDACQGDSGGPLSCLHGSNGQFSLAGLVSWGIGCGEPYMPGVYTDLSKYKAWITTTVESVDDEYRKQ